jgi:hypothetical protein
MSSCQVSAAKHLEHLLEEGYGWCIIDRNLELVDNWFDSERSWASVSWFTSIVWSQNINHGQQVIFSSQQILFMIVSVLANLRIISYHFSNEHHPKFSLTSFSRWCIRVHVLSGSIGVFLPLYVFFALEQSSTTALMFIFGAWDFIFSISALFQTPNVFGVRVLTIPLYTTCILFKLILNGCLMASLLHEPLGGFKTQVLWLWMCWTTHQTYAWVRIWYFFFISLDILRGHQYSISVFLAGMMCIGQAVGFHVLILLVLLVVVYSIYLTFKAHSMTKELAALNRVGAGGSKNRAEEIRRDAEMMALEWFESQFNPFSGNQKAKQTAVKLCQDHKIDFKNPHVSAITPSAVKAAMLFECVDLNQDGSISADELEIFLMGFGAANTARCAMKLLKRSDENSDGVIDVHEFEKHFAPYYLYAFDGVMRLIRESNDESSTRNMLEAMANSKNMIDRSFKFKKLRDFGSEGCPFSQMMGNSSIAMASMDGEQTEESSL